MKVLHVVPSFFPASRYGGPIVSVRRLCESLLDAQIDVEVATTNADGPGDLQVPVDRAVRLGEIPVTYFRRWPRTGFGLSAAMAMGVTRRAAQFDIIHITSTFSFPSLLAGVAARRASVPYVVSPRGSLQRWSLQQKRWKKAPYWWACERRHLSAAAAIHVTSSIEADELRNLVPGVPLIVVPNGVDIPPAPAVERDPRRIVFLGRLHPKKGFDVLIPALSRLARSYPDVETIVAGPDDCGEWHRIEQMLQAATPRPRVRYIGPVTGEDKYRLLASAAAFVLTSHAENFGQAVVEALACSTPVVVSRNCPWDVVERKRAGFWTPNDPSAVSEALARIVGDAHFARELGAAARLLASQYSWTRAGEAMAQAYRAIAARRREDT